MQLNESKKRAEVILDIYKNASMISNILNHRILKLDTLSQFDLTKSQFQALMLLERREQTTASELAAMLGMAKSNTTPLVDSLVNRKLVSRVYSQKDRRKVHLSLAQAGAAILKQIHMEMVHQENPVLWDADADQLTQLAETLQQLKTIVNDLT